MKNAVFWDVTSCGSCSWLLQEPQDLTSNETAFFEFVLFSARKGNECSCQCKNHPLISLHVYGRNLAIASTEYKVTLKQLHSQFNRKFIKHLDGIFWGKPKYSYVWQYVMISTRANNSYYGKQRLANLAFNSFPPRQAILYVYCANFKEIRSIHRDLKAKFSNANSRS
jgi:hypothetical protein